MSVLETAKKLQPHFDKKFLVLSHPPVSAGAVHSVLDRLLAERQALVDQAKAVAAESEGRAENAIFLTSSPILMEAIGSSAVDPPIPEIALKLMKAESVAQKVGNFLADLAECVKCSEDLKAKQAASSPSDLVDQVEIFLRLDSKTAALPEGSSSYSIMSERLGFLKMHLKSKICTVLQGLGQEFSGPQDIPLLRSSEAVDPENPFAGYSSFLNSTFVKFDRQFSSPPLYRLDRPEWPLKRATEIYSYWCQALPSANPVGFAEAILTYISSHMRQRWPACRLDRVLFSAQLEALLKAAADWEGDAGRILLGYVLDNSDGLLDTWVASDKEYCNSDDSRTVLEVLSAAVPRLTIAAIEPSASARLVAECYNPMIDSSVGKARESWNRLKGGCADVDKASLLVNSMQELAVGLGVSLASCPPCIHLSTEPQRIVGHMIARIARHIEEVHADWEYKVFTDPAVLLREVGRGLLHKYMITLRPDLWDSLHAKVSKVIDESLLERIEHSEVGPPEIGSLANNVELLGIDLPKVKVWLRGKGY